MRVPGTNIHVGADALLNLVPGVGTLVAKGLASYLILEARRHGVPTGTLLRMAGNVAVDFAISAQALVIFAGIAVIVFAALWHGAERVVLRRA